MFGTLILGFLLLCESCAAGRTRIDVFKLRCAFLLSEDNYIKQIKSIFFDIVFDISKKYV